MNIIDLFKENNNVKKILSFLQTQGKDFLVVNSTPNLNVLLCSLLFHTQNKNIVYVASNIYKASQAYEALCHLVGLDNVNFYAIDEVVATELLATSGEFLKERLFTFKKLQTKQPTIIVSHPTALTRPLHPLKKVNEYIINLKKGQTINLNEVIRKLVISGYQKTPLTQNVGSFSLRGGVLDIFPINNNNPIRVDLFDIEIDYIKEFDPFSQITTKEIAEIAIQPITELLYQNPAEIKEMIIKDLPEVDNNTQSELTDLENYQNGERLHKYIKYAENDICSFLDYIDDKIIIYEEIKHIKENYEKTQYELLEYFSDKKITNKLIYNLEFSKLFSLNSPHIYLSEFRSDMNNLTKESHGRVAAIFDLHGYSITDYANDLKSFILDIKSLLRPLIISATSPEVLGLIAEILKEHDVKYNLLPHDKDLKGINLLECKNGLSFGFADGFEVITEANIFKKYRSKKAKYRSASSNNISDINSLNRGDYVVHYDYGIAEYLGIKTVELQGIKNDYVMLKFANIEMYIPVENINLLEKYIGSEGTIPRLTTVGTKDWETKKNKVKKKLLSMAHDLIKLQAKREDQKGQKYDVDNEIQEAFESDFEYEETPDQLKVIKAIKTDMETGLIIDRLVCGDVGYGKTEVAMRVALKTVLGGAQVAYLAPTTILSRQQYQNFCERFTKYGVNVALINRHVDTKQQKEILKKIQEGSIDIIIGTHRLLSEDVLYKKLGLLIVDEEQRFGVAHKEKIKQIKTDVNVITLTATPIPRTLHMALIGVRQLSLIETPPLNRFPVQTYVLEYNANIIREAIYREIGRGGQVFYLHNRISDLEKIYRQLTRLVPEAKIIIAHGKMEKNALEDAIEAFVDREYDLLLCTTIIESGMDIPNTNTLIVDMADRLGLSQMYQIRGRVGRSDRLSYAYFMFEENKVLTQVGVKRLNAIKEFAVLGSGYKIAVRDLAIRGAGDILGREQSGFIDSIGLDMYIKLLNDAMEEARGSKKDKTETKSWNIEVAKHVSDKYVSDDEIKIFIHKEINSIKSKEAKEELLTNLVDRFGVLTEEIKNYIDKQYLDALLQKLHTENLRQTSTEVRISISQNYSEAVKGAALMQLVYQANPYIGLEFKGRRLHIILPKQRLKEGWIKTMIWIGEKILHKPSDFFDIDL